MMKKNNLLSKEVIFSSDWFSLVAKKFERGPSPYYAVEGPECVTVLAVKDDGKIILVNQFRQTLGKNTMELPGGHIDPGETPADAAKRELLEETGYSCSEITYMGKLYADTGRLSNEVNYFLATQLKRESYKIEDESVVTEISPEDLRAMIFNGEFAHSQDIACIMLAFQKHGLIF